MIFDLEKYKGNIAFLCENGMKVSYNDLLELSYEIEHKIGQGKLIFLLASNSVASLAYYISFLFTGNCVQIVPQETDINISIHYMNNYHPDYICCFFDKAEVFKVGSGVVGRYYDYGVFRYNVTMVKKIFPELALLLPTSGSTGNCKFVRISRNNIIANAKSIIQYLHISQHDRPIMSLPMSYTYGLSVIHSHIFKGATILLPSSPIYKKYFWLFFQRNHGTSFSGVPYSYELIDKLGFLKMDFPNLDCLTQAGGKLSENLQRKFAKYARENNVRFYIMYGQTEATARMTYLPYDRLWKEEKIGSVGIPIPDAQIKLLDKYGETVKKPFENGEIIFYGKNVSLGYAEDYKDLKKENENNFKLCTGDIAYYDDDGFYYICGRKNRFVKLLGKRVNMDDIECCIKEQFSGLQCAVTGNDKKLVIWIEKNQVDEIKNYIIKVLQCDRSLIDVKYIEKIPRNNSGKILYSVLNVNIEL